MTYLFITFHFPMTMALLLLLLSISSVEYSRGRELRPAEHDLTYDPDHSPEMATFFGSTLETTTPSSSNVPLPEARDISNASRRSGDGEGTRYDDVRKVLLLASLVCGTAGVVLLLVSAFFFLSRRLRNESIVSDSKPSTSSPLALLPPPLPPPPPISSAT